jgi:flagellar biosynthesis protein FlhF
MNLKRFTARSSREALALVRQAFGDDAVVMSTKPCADGVEVLAMAPESVQQLERIGSSAEPVRPALRKAAPAAAEASIEDDVEQLQMSTLSFQDYVRERMLKRRREQMAADAAAPVAPKAAAVMAPIEAARTRLTATHREPLVLRENLRDELKLADLPAAVPLMVAPVAAAVVAKPAVPARADDTDMLNELRSMRGLIEQRFGALAFMEKLQRQPRQAQLSQRLLDSGFSPALIRKMVDGLPNDVEESSWAASVLERNLATGEREAPLEDVGGVFALIGATGVGKTTSTAKLAAAFATRHGAANLGLITLDAYRVAAHEQLRTYGRILGVPVHTAHDRASLEDLLELLSAKKMVLIDTAGMAQRDTRTRELLDMLSHRSVNRLLVVNASAQGETIEDQLAAYNAASCRGVVLSKMDEAVKLGPALDSMIRHKLKVLAVANGQRVPEDWHRLSANALITRALKSSAGAAWRLDGGDVSLIFAGLPALRPTAAAAHV